MERAQYTVTVDIINTGITDTNIRLKQGDSGAPLYIKVENNGNPYYDANLIPDVYFRRTDKATVFGKAQKGNDNKYVYIFKGNELEVPGNVLADVKFKHPNGTESSATFRFECVVNTVSNKLEQSDIYSNNAQETLKKLEEFTSKSEDIVETVTSNAQAAASDAATAEAAASEAKKSAAAAATSASNAATSEKKAKTSEGAAVDSASAAASSEKKAKESENNAKNSESNAKNSESNAKTSEQNAKKSEENAKISEENARNYAESAEPSVQTASGLNPTLEDSTDAPAIIVKVNGKTEQDGEPTPDTPIDIVGVGENGSIEVKTTGKNLFNPNTVVVGEIVLSDGSFRAYTTEENYTKSLYSRSDFIECKANTNYYFENVMPSSVAYTLACYDENKNFLRTLHFSGTNTVSGVVNTGDNTKYIVVCYKTTDVNAVMVAESDVTIPFEPYIETTANPPLTAPLYEGDYIEYRADGSGKLVRNNNEVVINEKQTVYSVNDGNNGGKVIGIRYSACMPGVVTKTKSASDKICDKLLPPSTTEPASYLDCEIGHWGFNSIGVNTNTFFIFCIDADISTTEEAQTWLQSNPITVVYKLAEPIETPLTAEQIAEFEKLYTFEPVTNVFCDGEVDFMYYKDSDGGKAIATVHNMAKPELATDEDIDAIVDGTYAE